jgi:hypothetical protein
MKYIKIFFIILFLIILGYILFPKNIGFTEEMRLSNGEVVTTLGEYDQCLGIALSEKKGNRTNFRCIGIPFGKITI